MAGSANRRRRQSDGAHQAAESRSASKQQTNPARTTQIRFRKISAFPDSFLTPRRSQRNEGRTEGYIGTPDLIRPINRQSAQQIWVNLVVRMPFAGVRLLVDRLQAHHPHQPANPLAVYDP